MRNRHRLRTLFHKVYVLCLIIVLVGCMPATPTPTNTPTLPPTATDTPSPTEPPTEPPTPTETPPPLPPICETINEPETQETNGFFLSRQMTVTGPQQNIDQAVSQAISAVAPPNAAAVLLQICDLSFLSTLSFDTVSPPTIEGKMPVDWFFKRDLSEPDQRSDLSLQLYEVRGENVIIEEIISAVNNQQSELFVFADPNYLTGLMQNSEPCYLPTSGGGGGGGKPFGGFGIPVPGVQPPIEQQFMEQWAFSRQGIALPDTPSHNGQGTRVGIFDAFPIELLDWNQPFPAQPSDLDFGSIRNAVIEPELPLSANYLDGSDHGLVAAGLIHGVAEASEIHLIRVLNDEGCGRSFDLAASIFGFINQMGTTSDNLSLHNVVMNFSLGMSKPIQQPDQTDIQWGKLLDDFVAFETAIFEAQRLGAFIFAAAGNESTQTVVEDMVLPAAYDKIYGVAAINPTLDRSCFSNRGDIAAPGGDGGQDLDPSSNESCVPRSNTWQEVPLPPQCQTMALCRYGVIGLSFRGTGGPGYIFWAGTSFATPLAAGLAALTLNKAGGDPIIAECLIMAGLMSRPPDPDLGAGRINVERSLDSSCP